MKRVRTFALIATSMLSLTLPTLACAAPVLETPLNGPAYLLADDAYKAYARRDYAEAAEKTREALRLRPDSKRLASLLRKAEAAQRGARAPKPVRTARHPSPSTSPAFEAASLGYKSYGDGDYATAVLQAQRAVELAPANRDYRLLLVNAFSAASRWTEADQAVTDGVSAFGDDARIRAAREPIRRRMAETPATAAFAALERRDFIAAIEHARNAVALAPENRIYRMTLIQALLHAERFGEAETAASEAISLSGDDPSPRVLRAYARQRLSRRAEALADFEFALQRPGLGADAQRNIRLIAIDAALSAGEPQRALDLLLALPTTTDHAVTARLRAAHTDMARARSDIARIVTTANFPPPTLDCSKAVGPQQCVLLAETPRDPAFAAATAAYRAFDEKNDVQAIDSARQAVTLAPDNRDYQRLLVNALFRAGEFTEAGRVADASLATDGNDAAMLAQRGFIRLRLSGRSSAREDFESALRLGRLPIATEIGLLAELGHKAAARQRFERALGGGEFASLTDVDIAYLAMRVGDGDNALASFNRADTLGKLPKYAYQDAAYAALRAGQDSAAIAYFKRSIDEAKNTDGPTLRMDPQLLFNTRRAVAEVSRSSGVIASLTYRGAVSGLGPTPGTRAGADSLQAGIEGYWRPWGYRNGRYAEVFARAFETLTSKGDGMTGGSTLQSAVGVRVKPLAATNLVVSLSRVFARSGRRNDWLAQLGYSGGSGGELRVDAPSWWTNRVSAEAGRYFIARQNYALATVETGKSLRPDTDAMWVLFPHLSIAADYDSTAVERVAFGAGPGIGARYWFREDTYHAPRSYLDMTLQYRFRISGAERAEGVFLVTTLLY